MKKFVKPGDWSDADAAIAGPEELIEANDACNGNVDPALTAELLRRLHMVDQMLSGVPLPNLIHAFAKRLAAMTPEERSETMVSLGENFCHHCGRPLTQFERCHCWNDE